jgi:hypothetical protein
MAKIDTDEHFKGRDGNLLFYPYRNTMIVRTISGFTSEALKASPKYENCRQSANEFGRVSALCKQIRLALAGVLPKQNNLAVVYAFTKKMREAMNFDTTNPRGERRLADALATEEGRQFLKGYEFNPDADTVLDYALNYHSIQLNTDGISFPKGADVVGFRLHRLAFDFGTTANALAGTDWTLEQKTNFHNEVSIDLPIQPNADGLIFTILETQFYAYTKGTYEPVEDRGKSVKIVDIA